MTGNGTFIDGAQLVALYGLKKRLSGEAMNEELFQSAPDLVLPPNWFGLVHHTFPSGCAWMSAGGLTAICTDEDHAGLLWRHVSVSRPDELPSWSDLKIVRRDFFGEHRNVWQFLPPHGKYVNIHPNCLHLWAVIEGEDPAQALIERTFKNETKDLR